MGGVECSRSSHGQRLYATDGEILMTGSAWSVSQAAVQRAVAGSRAEYTRELDPDPGQESRSHLCTTAGQTGMTHPWTALWYTSTYITLLDIGH